MPYEVIWFQRGVEWRYTGHVTGREIVDSIMSIFGDARFDSLAYQIADLTHIESAQVQEREMKQSAYLDRAASQSNPHISVAIIASTPISRKIGQQYIDNAKVSPWDIQMFENRSDAERWLRSKRLIAS